MTSISAVTTTTLAPLQSKPPEPPAADIAPARISPAAIGSSSAAHVPSAIAALALRGDIDGDSDGH